MRLYGKDHIKQTLDAAACENRLPHAILLYGDRGAGKRVMAKYAAKLLLCGAPPCESCAVCKKINASRRYLPQADFSRKGLHNL